VYIVLVNSFVISLQTVFFRKDVTEQWLQEGDHFSNRRNSFSKKGKNVNHIAILGDRCR